MIDNLDIPLVITYCNKYNKTNRTGSDNTNRFVETLENNSWNYIILGEGEKWDGFITKIIAIKNFLENINPEKVVIISDAHDVYCLKNPKYFINDFKSYNKSIVVSMELFAEGSINYDFNKSYFQVTWLNAYFKHNNINYKNINKKFVNGGLYCGYAKNIYDFYNWLLLNNYVDDQKALGAFINENPNIAYLDINNELLHTTTSLVNCGIHTNNQIVDSPSINELIGQKSYFLHIPGINISKGQNFLYENIYKLLKFINFNESQKIYPHYNLVDYKLYYEKEEKVTNINTDNKELLLDLIKQNEELKKNILEQNKKIEQLIILFSKNIE